MSIPSAEADADVVVHQSGPHTVPAGSWLLPTVLSITAGSVDVIGFLALGGVFTAHITGNVVIVAVHYVSGGRRGERFAAGVTHLANGPECAGETCPSGCPLDGGHDHEHHPADHRRGETRQAPTTARGPRHGATARPRDLLRPSHALQGS